MLLSLFELLIFNYLDLNRLSRNSWGFVDLPGGLDDHLRKSNQLLPPKNSKQMSETGLTTTSALTITIWHFQFLFMLTHFLLYNKICLIEHSEQIKPFNLEQLGSDPAVNNDLPTLKSRAGPGLVPTHWPGPKVEPALNKTTTWLS